MNWRLLPILLTVLLDSAGMGLTLPVLPTLLRQVSHNPDLGWRFGAFLGLYALAQFLFSPILGSLSDRIGRRPVLQLSLAGAAIDYLFMSFAPSLGLLFVGRAIAGATSASMAVATAYVADVTAETQRTRAFGLLSACLGMGFIIGPAVGGVLGEYWMRAPFMVAAMLNAITFLFVWKMLPEGKERNAAAPISLDPFAPLRWALSFSTLMPLMVAYLVIALVGQIGGTVWMLYGSDRYGWSPAMLGLSMTGFGLFHALSQAFLAGSLVERWGERRTMVLGIVADCGAYMLIAFASRSWMALALLPLLGVGGVAVPALRSLLSRCVDDQHQGRLQGVLASLVSLAAIVGPPATSAVYFATHHLKFGAVWIIGGSLYIFCLPALVRGKDDRSRR